MREQKEKVRVPAYKMGLAELYLLLRIRMEQTGRKSINGVKKAFFEPDTYQNHNKLLKSLVKKKLLEEQDGNVLMGDGLRQGLEVILNAAHCMNFQNELLRKKDQILTFYYADGKFAGILQDRKNSLLVCTEDKEALYMAFEGILEAKGVSASFQTEKWEKLHGEKIENPVREAVLVHSGNRIRRQRLTLAMVADKRRLYLLGGEDIWKYDQLERDTQSAASWFGVVLRELGRLKDEGDKAEGAGPRKEEPRKQKSEYRRIVETEGFPRSGPGFWFWCLRKIAAGFPGMIKGAAKKKFLSAFLFLVWGAVLFFYNMYATCYLNDTFMLDRRARWGNLTPYLMAGTMGTPSTIKGLNVNLGYIDTAFLVWPLMMLVTLIGRHLIRQIRTQKLGFLISLLGIPGDADECRRLGYGRGRQMWIPFLAVWIGGFFLMNPVTLFLAALYCMLIFAQKDNGLVRLCMLWRCAGNRKQVEAGTRPEPRSEKYRMVFFQMGRGFLIYAFVSLVLWFAAGYHFWIRLIVTLLMVLFALLQIFWPQVLSDPEKMRKARMILLLAAGGMAAAWFGSRYGIVLADDGGWSESGGYLGGLLQNAGFSTILGLTLMTIGLALGGPAAWVLAGSCLAGVGVFAIGCTDTKAGDYVRKTSRQYFFGPEDGETKTLFCTATEIANFVAGFLNPAAGSSGTAMKLFHGGQLVSDVVSTLGDSAATGKDLAEFMAGTGEVSTGDLLLDVLGLGLDFYGFYGDLKDADAVFEEVNLKGDAYRYEVEDEGNFFDQYDDIQNQKNQEVSDMQADIGARKQAELDAETGRHNQKVDDIQESIRKTQNGEVTPPMDVDKDTYLRELSRSLGCEENVFADTMSEIRARYGQEARQLEDEILKKFSREEWKLLIDETVGLVGDGYDYHDIYSKLKDSLKSWLGENQQSE